MNSILIRGGRVIDPAGGTDGAFDVLIADGILKSLGPPNTLNGDQTIEAARCWIMPGLVDPHVHLRDPGFPEKETIETGLRAAAAGGFTAVAAMANTSPVNDSPEITRYMLQRAASVHAARLVPVSAVTKGQLGQEHVNYAAMVEAGARLFSDDGIPIDDQSILAAAMEKIGRLGFAISLHEEDRGLTTDGAVNEGESAKRLGVKPIPVAAETRRVQRDLPLAIGSGASVHIAHVSAAESLDLIRAARAKGANVTCEATPHHFSLDDSAVLSYGPNAKMSPPLRSHSDVQAVTAAMGDGTIDMIATDHAPHDYRSKQMDSLAAFFGPGANSPLPLPGEQVHTFAQAANGVIGLETALGLAMRLVHRSVIAPSRLAELMSLNPSRLLRLKFGTLAPGAIADVTIIDPDFRWTVDPEKFLSKSRNTPFSGMELRGKAIMTIVGGRIVYDARRGERA